MRDVSHRLITALRMRQLELLSTLADAGNMRAAAQRLHISTAAVSKGLHELEGLFGVKIFNRLPRGIAATSAGTLIVQRARVLLSEVAQLSDELAARSAGAGEGIRIGAPPFIAWTLVPRLLCEMSAHGSAPGVRIVEGRLADICGQLEAGDIDVLITMNTPSELGGLKPDGFMIDQIGTDQWLVVCAPDHPLAPRGRRPAVQRWEDLSSANWILPPRPTNARMMLEQVMLQHGLTPIVPHIDSMNAITNLQLAEQSLGLTLVARSVVEDRLRRGTLVEIPMQDLPPPVPIALVYRLSAARRESMAALLAAAQRLRNEDASVSRSDKARTRKFSVRKSRP
jgi:DNA-binding transcriptional LysR family regulator